MRFALRTLVPVFAAVVVAITSIAFSPRPASAQGASKKSAEAPAKETKDTAVPATDSTATAPPTEAPDPAPLLAKGEAALKAGDYPAAVAAFNEAGKAAQQATQGPDTLKAQIAALV